MNRLAEFFKFHGGYARMSDMKTAGIHTRDIARAVSDGVVVKVKAGLYKLNGYEWDEHSAFLDICRANRSAVICLSSALAFYGLTTFNPSEITVAVPHNTDRFELLYPPIRVFYFPHTFYKTGMSRIDSRTGTIKIYNREKTICDLFRYRNKLGLDLALEGLRNYLKLKEANIRKLKEYAEICQVKTIMIPYVKAIVG